MSVQPQLHLFESNTLDGIDSSDTGEDTSSASESDSGDKQGERNFHLRRVEEMGKEKDGACGQRPDALKESGEVADDGDGCEDCDEDSDAVTVIEAPRDVIDLTEDELASPVGPIPHRVSVKCEHPSSGAGSTAGSKARSKARSKAGAKAGAERSGRQSNLTREGVSLRAYARWQVRKPALIRPIPRLFLT